MHMCMWCEAEDRYLAMERFNAFQKRISELFSRAML